MENLQRQRTQRAIDQAFIELLKEEGFRKISVTAIATRALINRQTFYNYYQDKYDLAAKLSDRYFDDFKQIIDQRMQGMQDHVHLEAFLEQTINAEPLRQFLLANGDTLAVLLDFQIDDHGLRNRLQAEVAQKMKQAKLAESDYVIGMFSNFAVVILQNACRYHRLPTKAELQEIRQGFIKITY